MEVFHAVPTVAALLDQQNFGEALRLIDGAVEVFAAAMDTPFPLDYHYSPEEALVLAKLSLIRRDYRRSIEAALCAQHLLDSLEPFYQTALRFRMMEWLIEEAHGRQPRIEAGGTSLRSFVLAMIASDNLDISYLGYLAEIREYDLLKQKLRDLLMGGADATDLINALLDIAYDDVFEVFIDIGRSLIQQRPATASPLRRGPSETAKLSKPSTSKAEDLEGTSQRNSQGLQNEENSENSKLSAETISQPLINYIVDAFIAADDTASLSAFLERLPWRRLYQACFYIEDTHRLPLTLSNENANLILSGDWKEEILGNFLFRNSKTSFRLIEALSKARAPYVALCNSIMNAGTTNDTLYRNNKGLLAGREWTRFLDLASIGMIHQGNANGFEILREMLPSLESAGGEPAALMALGLMSVRKGDREVTEYLLNWLDHSDPEMVFGACMGLGLNLLEAGDGAVGTRLRALLAVDSTVVQESAAYALGMLYAGTDDEEVGALLAALCERSDFARLRRASGVAAALVAAMTMAEPRAFALGAADAYERAAAALAFGTAYVGTSDLSVIAKLLPLTSDSDDDVKRAAVIAVALVGYEDADITASCLVPLAQSHSMHVRAAVAVVLGLLNSGVGEGEVVNLLEALLYDSEALVRQGAAIGAGCALAQMNPTLVPNYKRVIDRVNHMLAAKGEAACVRIGAALGRAFAEAAGRSAVMSLRNLSRQLDVKRVVGAVMFLQSWYWYPLMGLSSLCMLPTPVFFFDENLDETEHVLANDAKYYDYLVRLPETRRSRKGRGSRDGEFKDTMTEAPRGLRSGDRLTYLERLVYDLESVVVFKSRDEE